MRIDKFSVDLQQAADSTELWAFDAEVVRFADLRQRLIREIPVDDNENYEASELKEHAAVEAEKIWQVLETRQRVTGRGYPFTFSRDRLKLRSDWVSRSAYMLTVLLVHCEKEKVAEARIQFEFLTGRAIATLFSCDWIRFGANRRHPVPGSLRKAIDYLTDQLGEGGKVKAKAIIPKNGDFDCDVVAWHNFHDECKSKFIVIGHCATSPNWKVQNKHLEGGKKLQSKTDGDWFSPVIKVFATPYINLSDLDLIDIAHADGILLNRWRIAHLAVRSNRAAVSWLRDNKAYASTATLKFWS